MKRNFRFPFKQTALSVFLSTVLMVLGAPAQIGVKNSPRDNSLPHIYQADFTRSGNIGPDDLLMLATDWGSDKGGYRLINGDLDGNEVVDSRDLSLFLRFWGQSIPNAPTFVSHPPQLVQAGTEYIYQIRVEDISGHAVDVRLLDAPDGCIYSPIDRILTWSVPESQEVAGCFLLEASNGVRSSQQFWEVNIQRFQVAATGEINGNTGGVISATNPDSPIYGASVSIAPGLLTGSATVTLSAVSFGNPTFGLVPVCVDGFQQNNTEITLELPLDKQMLELFDDSENHLILTSYDPNTGFWTPISNTGKVNVYYNKTNQPIGRVTVTFDKNSTKSGLGEVFGLTDTRVYVLLYQPISLNDLTNSASSLVPFKPHEKIVILVHGVNADANTFSACNTDFLHPDSYLKDNLLKNYDRIMTFQYQSGNAISDSAIDFLNALEKYNPRGADGRLEIHVIAHSMGGLVTRYMLEQTKRAQYLQNVITRLIMIATPNNGGLSTTSILSSIGIANVLVPVLAPTILAGSFIVYNEIRTNFPGVFDLLPPTMGNGFFKINRYFEDQSCVKTHYYAIAGISNSRLSNSDGIVKKSSALALNLGEGFERTFQKGSEFSHTNLHCLAETNGVGDQVMDWLNATEYERGSEPPNPLIPDVTVVVSCQLGEGMLTQNGNQNKILVRLRDLTDSPLYGADVSVGLCFGAPYPEHVFSSTEIVPISDQDYLDGWATYRFEDDRINIYYIGRDTINIYVQAPNNYEGNFSFDVDVEDQQGFFKLPPKGFFYEDGSENVGGRLPDTQVTWNGQPYQVYRMWYYDHEMGERNNALLVLNQNYDIPSINIYKSVSLIAMIDLMTFENTEQMLESIADAYRDYDKLTGIGKAVLTTRGILSKALGFLGAAYITGGANVTAGGASHLTKSIVIMEFSRIAAEEIISENVDPTNAKNVLWHTGKITLRTAAASLEEAAQLSRMHHASKWDIVSASEYFKKNRLGSMNGTASVQLLSALLPDADLYTQFKDVFIDIGSGAIGGGSLAIESVKRVFYAGQGFFYLLSAMDEGDEVRLRFDNMERTWSLYPEIVKDKMAGTSPVNPPKPEIPETVEIPSGNFTMGVNVGNMREILHGDVQSEYPPRQVTIANNLLVGQHPITNLEYASLLNWALSTGRLPTPNPNDDVFLNQQMLLASKSGQCGIEFNGYRFSPKEIDGEYLSDHPVVQITWYGALAYCNWLSEYEQLTPCYDLSDWTLENPNSGGYRLPSEAEWEYALRGPETNPNRYAVFPFGDDDNVDLDSCTSSNHFNNYMVWCGNSMDLGVNQTFPVGTKQPQNSWNIYDMAGNVFEWCGDPWHSDYTDAPTNGSVWEAGGDPAQRVTRGGGYLYSPWYCRTSFRTSFLSGSAYQDIGFRIVKTN